MNELPTVKPVFFKANLLGEKKITVFDICHAAEKVSGKGTIFGAQKVSGIFRIYPLSEPARAKLLLSGFSLGSLTILPVPLNPSRTFTREGVEIPSTRLFISNIYLSVSDSSIIKSVEKAGYKVLSDISLNCSRDPSGRLTSFRNGTRSVLIEKPSRALPQTVRVQGTFTAFLYYPGREDVEGNLPFARSNYSEVKLPDNLPDSNSVTGDTEVSDTSTASDSPGHEAPPTLPSADVPPCIASAEAISDTTQSLPHPATADPLSDPDSGLGDGSSVTDKLNPSVSATTLTKTLQSSERQSRSAKKVDVKKAAKSKSHSIQRFLKEQRKGSLSPGERDKRKRESDELFVTQSAFKKQSLEQLEKSSENNLPP